MKSLFSILIWLFVAMPATAEILIEGAYLRSASPAARSGAGYMEIRNTGTTDERLIEVRGDAAARIGLHENIIADGVASMVAAENGFVIPAGGFLLLDRAGKHIMLMGLTQPFVQGETVSLLLVFEKAGEIAVEFIVDRDR